MRNLTIHTRQGHVPFWDGSLWHCPVDGCGFLPTDKNGAALYHYEQSLKNETVQVFDSEEDFA